MERIFFGAYISEPALEEASGNDDWDYIFLVLKMFLVLVPILKTFLVQKKVLTQNIVFKKVLNLLTFLTIKNGLK